MISPTEAVGVPKECIEVATYGQKFVDDREHRDRDKATGKLY